MFLFVISIVRLSAQGCSDAGICSISPGQFDLSDDEKNAVDIGYIYGKGLADVSYHNFFLGYTRYFQKNWSINYRATYNQAMGSFGTLGNFGDMFLVVSKNILLTKNNSLKPSLGFKAPLSTSNYKINKIPLPMDYQPGLGTFDALFSLDYTYKNWSMDAALQIPFWQINRNSYFDEYSASNDFPSTNLFKRKSDLLIRSSYTIKTNNNGWFFRPGVMAIYHLNNDTYEDIFGDRQEIKKSKGLTINLNLTTGFSIDNRNAIQISLAAPVLVREVRPDGLTRSFVGSLAYNYKF